MCIEECPKCGKFSFDIDLKTNSGKCRNCGHQEKINEADWNLKYDDGYKELRAALKYSDLRREHIVEYFELEKPDSRYARYLLTHDVIKTLGKVAPETYKRLVKSFAIKCVTQ